jgi:hypothetical protein
MKQTTKSTAEEGNEQKPDSLPLPMGFSATHHPILRVKEMQLLIKTILKIMMLVHKSHLISLI